VLDDDTMGRVIDMDTEQRDDLWRDDLRRDQEQVRCQSVEPLTAGRRRKVERLTGPLRQRRAVIDTILTLTDDLKDGDLSGLRMLLCKPNLEGPRALRMLWLLVGSEREASRSVCATF